MKKHKDWLELHWETEDRLYSRFKGQPVERYLDYLEKKGRMVAEKLNIPAWKPPARRKLAQKV